MSETKMKLRPIGFAFAIALAVAAGAQDDPSTKVQVDGQEVHFKGMQPRIVVGRLLVPMRGVFEKMGGFVEYDPVAHKVTARNQNSTADVTIGQKIAHNNGAEILLDTRPVIIKGITLVPLRFLAEALGAKVTFDSKENTVYVTTKPKSSDPDAQGS